MAQNENNVNNILAIKFVFGILWVVSIFGIKESAERIRQNERRRTMTIYDSKEEFEKLEFSKPSGEFNGCVIIPMGYLHDSGFNCMKFALLNHNEVVGCVGGGSDVIHLNGIGGYGKLDNNFQERIRTRKTDIVDWSIDCLPNGLIRVFSSKPLSIDDIICSDFQLYAKTGE